MIEGNGPGKDIGNFHIKDEKKGSNKIKGDRISKSSRAGRNDATLIGPQLFGIRFFFTEPARNEEESNDQKRCHQAKNPEDQNPGLPRGKGINVWHGLHVFS